MAAAFETMLLRRCLGLAAAGNAADDNDADDDAGDDDGDDVEASELLRCLATLALDADADASAPCCPAAALESALAFLLASRLSATSFL